MIQYHARQVASSPKKEELRAILPQQAASLPKVLLFQPFVSPESIGCRRRAKQFHVHSM